MTTNQQGFGASADADRGSREPSPSGLGPVGLRSTSGKLRVLSLFAGIGGFDLGLERAGGFETAAFCEIDPFARRVLAKHWPEVLCYDDIRELTAEQLGADGIAVDVVCGGFPCQAFSSAARGRNNAVDLWPEYARISRELHPRFAIAENVAQGPIERAAEHFRGLGLSCLTIRISADEVGADHKRLRWWAVAHPYSNGELLSAINAEMAKLRAVRDRVWGPEAYRTAVGVSDGLSSGLGNPGPYGNAVVPQIPELIGRAILASRTPPVDRSRNGGDASAAPFTRAAVPERQARNPYISGTPL